ncbi:S8 family serine peptidase [Candidatus Woesearchaeota archaeon]|nr:S8 family serine peptidase [Candidatus Woesearchaeota archaeon]
MAAKLRHRGAVLGILALLVFALAVYASESSQLKKGKAYDDSFDSNPKKGSDSSVGLDVTASKSRKGGANAGTDIQAAKGRSKREGKIELAAYESKGEKVKIIVEVEKDDNYLKSMALGNEFKEFGQRKFKSITVSKSELGKLEGMDSVKKVWIEKQYEKLLELSAPIINAESFWNNGYNGSNVSVCVIDTGIYKSHPAFGSRVIAEKDFVTSDSDGDNPDDYHGHGTHVAGTVAGNNETYKGIAFGANLINAKVFSSSTDLASTTDIMSAIDWCITQGADILTLSLGGGDETNDGSDSLSQYVDLAVDQGKIVTIAAGNSGPGGSSSSCRTARDSSGSSYSICEPGLAHKVITVGSSQTGKSGTTKDGLSGFSGRGPTGDERIKPDLLAPGEVITSTWKDGSFNSISGTSMATPHVAGLAALLLQAKRNLTPEETKVLFMNSVYDYGVFVKDNDYGTGRINASRALNEINYTKIGNITKYDKVHNIFVPSGTKEIRATLYWPENYSIHNNIDLYLLDPSGRIRDLSTWVYNTDEMVISSSPNIFGWWKILVNPFDVNGTQKYAIASSIMPSEQMFIKINATSNITFHHLNVTDSSQLKVNIDWNQTAQDMNIFLYNTSGILKSYSNATNTSSENITIENAEAGLWLLKVVPAGFGRFSNIKYAITSTFDISNQTFDVESPIVNLTSPANSTYSGNVNLSFIPYDNFNSFIDCYRSVNETKTFIDSVKNGTQYSTIINLGDGAYSLSVNCTDLSNNFGVSEPAAFSVDATPPNITINSPSNNSFYNVNLTTLNLTSAESAAWINGSLDNGQFSNFCQNCSSYNKTFESLTDGLHSLIILASDLINIANLSISFTIDTILPSIRLSSLTNNSAEEIGTIVKFNISDATGISAWYWNGSINISLGEHSINTSNFTKREFATIVYANDSAGNLNSQFFKFILDSRPIINTTPVNLTLEDESYSYDSNASDADNDSLNFSLIQYPEGITINSSTGIVAWVPSNSDVGSHSITLNAGDGNLSSNQTFILEVINVNDAPNLTTALIDIKFPEDSFNDTLNLSRHFTDVDNATLSYSASSNDTNVSITIYQNSTIKFNSSKDWNGIANATILASDGQYNASGSFIVNITPVNDAPVLNTIQNITVNETGLADIYSSGNVMATDIDGDNIQYTYTAPLNASGQWQTTYTDARKYLVTVTANDSNGGIDQKNVVITVLDKPKDENDTVVGNITDIITTIPNLDLKINNSFFNSSGLFKGLNKLNFTEGNKTLIEFDFSFSNSSKFSFVGITINSTKIDGKNSLIIRGINLTGQGSTKTVYLNRTNTTYNSVCIRDEDISSITEMTSDCSSSSETKLPCDGISTNSYICTLEDTAYKITGLLHSGITQISYDRPSSSPSSSSPSSSSSGGGGGGGTPGFVCFMDWKCGEWSECKDGKQARQCDFVKVPQHVQETQCPEASKPPETEKACEAKVEAAAEENETKNIGVAAKENTIAPEQPQNNKPANKGLMSAITGAVSRSAGTAAGKAGIMLALLAIAGIGWYSFKYYRKSSL